MALFPKRTTNPRIATPLLALVLSSLLYSFPPTILARAPQAPNLDWGATALIHPTRQILGATSCAATACHGGPSAGVSSTTAPRGSEYPLWLESDPHAKSWQTLNSPKSLDILERLNIVVDGNLRNPTAFKNCLACHNSSTELVANLPLPKTPEGVGCEACHGPAEKWNYEHYQGPHSIRNAVENLGMVNTKSLTVQAKACTLCHVGAPDRDMNHEIIAAGHPALYFDFNAYLQAYPKHWRLPPDSQSNPDRTAQQWLAGQLAAADSELALLQTRLRSEPHSASTWPEFANFQCTDCHQPISSSPTLKRTPLGQPTPRRWNLQALWILNSSTPTTLPPQLESLSLSSRNDRDNLILNLQNQRNELSQHKQFLFPQNGSVNWQNSHQRKYAANLWNHLLQNPNQPNWEIASLAYVASLPAIQAPSMPVPPKIQSQLSNLRQALLFPPNSQSPQTLTTIHWEATLAPVIEALSDTP